MHVLKVLIPGFLMVAATLGGCSAITATTPPSSPPPDCCTNITVGPYAAEAYLTRRVSGDEASCAGNTRLGAPVVLEAPVTAPTCELHGAAAAISLVANYYGANAAVCEVTEALASVPAPAGLPGCCGQDACDGWRCDSANRALDEDAEDIAVVLAEKYEITSKASGVLLPELDLRRELSAGRPVIVKFGNAYPVRWGVIVSARPPLATAWRDAGLYTYGLADMATGEVNEVGYGELTQHPQFGRVTASWAGIIPAGRCE